MSGSFDCRVNTGVFGGAFSFTTAWGKVIGTHISLGFNFESIDLHWEGPVDEVRWLVVDVLHLDDHPLVVCVCGGYNQILDYYSFKWI